MIKYLIRMRVCVNERCFGRFFSPDDQNKLLKTNPLDECFIFPTKTNYMGISYLGEYPLSHAAVLNQQEAVRVLCVKGADPNMQDTNGNTVFHMLVINNNFVSFKCKTLTEC
jgi:hypothetical protein